MTTNNVFVDLPQHSPDELFTTLLNDANVRIERIVSHGHASPEGCWYDQDQHEWVVVVKGAARLRFEDQTVEMKPGDFVNIPAHRKHRVEWTTPDEPTLWLAVHYGDQQCAPTPTPSPPAQPQTSSEPPMAKS
jgi:cupin 2 domain-containing protein